MKNTKTIRSQLLGVVIDTVLVSLVLVIMTLVIYQHMEKGYETSTEQMLLLNSYYHTLEDINGVSTLIRWKEMSRYIMKLRKSVPRIRQD